MEKEFKKLIKAHEKYSGCVEEMELKMSQYIDFEFSVLYQPADGFVILAESAAENAPLSDCISHIKKHGSLSYVEYTVYTI